MARKQAYPRMSGANPAVRAPKAPTDTRLHMRRVVCYGETMRDGFEVWTACGLETTEHGAQTTYARSAVTCGACR
jgi:hypothetical protein